MDEKEEQMAQAAKREVDLLAYLDGNGEPPPPMAPKCRDSVTATRGAAEDPPTMQVNRTLDVPHENSLHASLQDRHYTSAELDNNESIINGERDNKEDKNDFGNRSPPHIPGVDTYFSDEKIVIPEGDDTFFSFRKLWAFTGPGFLMSIAFLDPGNVESDMQAGTIANYKLIWVLLSATILGLLMQRLSMRLGVVSGLHLAEMCYRQFHTFPRILLWIMTEIAIIGSDMQEVIGTAIALYLLSSKALPMWAGVVITILDTFTFLFLDKYGLRKLELLFGFFIATMAISFGYEYVVSAPPQGEVMKGMFIPWCTDCDTDALLQAVGIIGANIQPHNLYLHSALVKSRDINRKEPKKVREANKYFFSEAAIALFISFLINLFIMAVFAYGFFHKTNADIYEVCENSNFTIGTEFYENNNETVQADLYGGGVYLGCRYGFVAMIIWAIGLLAAGQSSTMTGTYAGQFSMEGFLNLQWPRWKRVLLTRSIAIVPTFFVAFFTSIDKMTAMNDALNVVMSLQLPFAALPTIAFTSSAFIMGDFKNGLFNKVLSSVLSLFIIAMNIYLVSLLVSDTVNQMTYQGQKVLVILITAVIGIFYVIFCLYLIVYVALSMGATWLNKFQFISKYVRGPHGEGNGAPNLQPTSGVARS